jgi:LacI family transcriptional regulator
MTRNVSTPLQDLSHRRPTVLLALEWHYEALERGVVDYARSRGWHLLDLRHYEMRLPRPFRPDGVLFCLPTERLALVSSLLGLGIPMVQVDDEIDDETRQGRWPCVLKDGKECGRLAAEHFLERGFRNLAYLRSSGQVWGSDQIGLTCESFVAHAEAAGARAEVFEIQYGGKMPWHRLAKLTQRFRKAISGLAPPLGVFTYHDVMAIRICHYCEVIGLSVPEQVAVLGFGNSVLQCDCAAVPLSSVDPARFDQGRTAAGVLDRMMGGEPAPREPIMIPPKVVVTRQSTDMLAVPDLHVARALRYIWANYDKGIAVADVADAVGTGRRKLERRFMACLGRTVNEEFTRKRIERCCELLTNTTMAMPEIARQVGGLSESYLFRLFKKTTGITPRQYRLANRPQLGRSEP